MTAGLRPRGVPVLSFKYLDTTMDSDGNVVVNFTYTPIVPLEYIKLEYSFDNFKPKEFSFEF